MKQALIIAAICCLYFGIMSFGCSSVPTDEEIRQADVKVALVEGTPQYGKAVEYRELLNGNRQRNDSIVNNIGESADSIVYGLGGLIGLIYGLYNKHEKVKVAAKAIKENTEKKDYRAALNSMVDSYNEIKVDIKETMNKNPSSFELLDKLREEVKGIVVKNHSRYGVEKTIGKVLLEKKNPGKGE